MAGVTELDSYYDPLPISDQFFGHRPCIQLTEASSKIVAFVDAPEWSLQAPPIRLRTPNVESIDKLIAVVNELENCYDWLPILCQFPSHRHVLKLLD